MSIDNFSPPPHSLHPLAAVTILLISTKWIFYVIHMSESWCSLSFCAWLFKLNDFPFYLLTNDSISFSLMGSSHRVVFLYTTVSLSVHQEVDSLVASISRLLGIVLNEHTARAPYTYWYIPFTSLPGTGAADSQSSFNLKFLKNVHYVFCNDVMTYIPTSNVQELPFRLMLVSICYLESFWNKHSYRDEVIAYCDFDLCFSNDQC